MQVGIQQALAKIFLYDTIISSGFSEEIQSVSKDL